jgi:hypothetical protein
VETWSHHHILPMGLGGLNEPSNIIALCSECHSKIHGRDFTSSSKLIKEGIAKARELGKQIGRLPIADSALKEKVAVMREAGLSTREISKELGGAISKSTVHKLCKNGVRET